MAYDEPRSAPGRATAATPRANDAPRERLPRWKAHARVCYGPAMSIRLANLRGRATLVVGEGLVDVEERSGRRFSADPMAAMRDWAPLADWARGLRAGDATAVLRTEELGPPVPRPAKVFAIGVNYRAHVAEAGMELPKTPMVFTKFPSCLAGPGTSRRSGRSSTSPATASARTSRTAGSSSATSRRSSVSGSRSTASVRPGPPWSRSTSSRIRTTSRSPATWRESACRTRGRAT